MADWRVFLARTKPRTTYDELITEESPEAAARFAVRIANIDNTGTPFKATRTEPANLTPEALPPHNSPPHPQQKRKTMSSNAVRNGLAIVGILGLAILQVALIALTLMGVITAPWWMIFAPVWVPIVFMLALIVIVIVFKITEELAHGLSDAVRATRGSK